MRQLLLATTNQGKLRELKQAFTQAGLAYQLLANQDLNRPPVVAETGHTFVANAKLKSHALADFSGLITIADDSGLAVDALDGEPGVRSARYAGDHDDALNNAKLLANLGGVPSAKRTATFKTTVVASVPNHPEADLVVTGAITGRILTHPVGADGFGYDPLFWVPELAKSFAEMTVAEKNAISHRGQAIKQLLIVLPAWLAAQTD
ncbi:MAG: XTP/dITP diphosphatase [Lactobacillus sp.]